MSDELIPSSAAAERPRLELVEHFPPLREGLVPLAAPIAEVTVLEDRAQVRRVGSAAVRAGQQRLVVLDIAPVVQDVSVRATVVRGAARVADVAVQRSMRVRRIDQPEVSRSIDEEIRALRRDMEALVEARERDETRARAVTEMLEHAAAEIPEDAAWGRVDTRSWQEGFGRLFEQARRLQQSWLEARWQMEDVARELQNAVTRRLAALRPDQFFVAWLELELVADAPGEVELAIEYVVPNALWRPIHVARLVHDDAATRLVVESQAAVWQHTGEDWTDVALVCSTAQASLGIEPPVLADDLLSAQRRSEQVVVEQREVELQRAGVGGGGAAPAPAAPRAVDLPGVDDGGEVQNLRADAPVTLPSDGRPGFVRLFGFEDPQARARLVLVPELAERVFLEVRGHNRGRVPLLAGPVELVRGSGTVGWTETLFVAPGEALELGFGPQHDVRVGRDARLLRDEVDPVDQWRRRSTLVRLFLSNLTDAPRHVHVTERVPVSELEHVRIALLETLRYDPNTTFTSDTWALDADGLCTLELTLEPYGRRILTLVWEMAVAPGVSF